MQDKISGPNTESGYASFDDFAAGEPLPLNRTNRCRWDTKVVLLGASISFGIVGISESARSLP